MLRALMTFGVLVLLSSLGGCSSSMNFVDDTMSKLNDGGNCSFARLLRGQTACEPPEETVSAEDEKKVFCYQTLGGVDCYEKVDPFAASEGRSPAEKIILGTPVVGPSKPATKLPLNMTGPASPMAQQPVTPLQPLPKPAPAAAAAATAAPAPAIVNSVTPGVSQPLAKSPPMPKPIEPTTPKIMPEEIKPATVMPPKLKPSRKVWPKPVTPAIES